MVREQVVRAPQAPDTRPQQLHMSSRLRPSSPNCTLAGPSSSVPKRSSAAPAGRWPKSSNEFLPRRPQEPSEPFIPPFYSHCSLIRTCDDRRRLLLFLGYVMRPCRTRPKDVSECNWERVLLMMSSTRIPSTVSASAMRERWQRQGTASAHINALRFCRANLISLCSPASNS